MKSGESEKPGEIGIGWSVINSPISITAPAAQEMPCFLEKPERAPGCLFGVLHRDLLKVFPYLAFCKEFTLAHYNLHEYYQNH